MSKTDIKNNKITQAFWILTIVLVSLLLLSLLPAFNIGSFRLKKIDIFSDLRPDRSPSVEAPVISDSLATIKAKSPNRRTSKPSLAQIEDYSGDEKILDHFNKAIETVNRQPVRIAFFGDSFIEGDIITASLRDTLQKVFGGNGVGLVPLASETSSFRKSIKHTYRGWNAYSLINVPNEDVPIGISGYTFTPEKENSVEYMPGKVPPQKKFKRVRLLYQNKGMTSVYYSINEATEESKILDSTNTISQYTINHEGIQSIQFHIAPAENIFLFGVSIEDSQGIYIDNFAMRRNSGIALSHLSPELLKQFNRYLNYKLIILQYGLNVASEADSTNYAWYSGKMITIIRNLKEVFPQTSFLLISVSDRSVNKEGEVVTMDAIPRLRDVQREIARKSGIAFWDMYEAMGGKNSIAQYTAAVPPLASKDYTHLTHLGGIKIGKKLGDVLLQEIKKHEE